MVPSRAQSFHRGFLGGEAGGVTLHAVRLGIAVSHLSSGKNALQKARPETLNRAPDAGDFGNIDTGAYDHVRDCPRQ
jgi:hypothetical protein